ncbi:hypothetical protein BDV25DRAFT_154509, partial [Aspergillus avenaceus]
MHLGPVGCGCRKVVAPWAKVMAGFSRRFDFPYRHASQKIFENARHNYYSVDISPRRLSPSGDDESFRLMM